MISLRHGKTKVHVVAEERIYTSQDTTSLYVEAVHMLDGLVDEEVDHFLEEHPTIVSLFDIHVVTTLAPMFLSQPRRRETST